MPSGKRPFPKPPKEHCAQRWQSGYGIQSVRFRKGVFTVAQARQWAKAHGFAHDVVDETKNWISLRQLPPEYCGCYAYNRQPIKGDTIRFLFCGWPPGYEAEQLLLSVETLGQKKALRAARKARAALPPPTPSALKPELGCIWCSDGKKAR
jgi:hypothetical protein